MLTSLLPAAGIIVEFLIRAGFAAYILMRRRGNPNTNLVWVIVFLALPLICFVAWFLVGDIRLGRKRVERHAAITERIVASNIELAGDVHVGRAQVAGRFAPLASMPGMISSASVLRGNHMVLHSDYNATTNAIIEDISRATQHCHVLMYIFRNDRSGQKVVQAMADAVKRGVTCRLLVDGVGSRHFLKSPLAQHIRDAGIQLVEMLPANVLRLALSRVDVRNHRKIVVIDGLIAYTGSQNIADNDYLAPYGCPSIFDTMVRIEGPIARELQSLFIEDWYMDNDELLDELLEVIPPVHDDGVIAQCIATGPNFGNDAIHELLRGAIHLAREEIVITTPYFVPDESTTSALRTAARRGVEVSLILPRQMDAPVVRLASHSYYEPMLEAGVHIYEFPDGLLHAKTMTIDRELALIGSANMDRRSFEINYEITLIVYDTDFASRLRFLQMSYRGDSKPVKLTAWRDRGVLIRLTENLAGILSPLL